MRDNRRPGSRGEKVILMEVEPVREWSPPDPAAIVLESSAAMAAGLVGGYSVARYRRKLFPLWLAAVISWFTLCKHAICRHCEHFGEPCEFFNLGLLAKKLWKERSPVSELNTREWMTEAVSVCLMHFLPLFATRGRARLRRLYLVLLATAQLSQFLVSCRVCAQTAKDPWKAKCPNYRLGRWVFVG